MMRYEEFLKLCEEEVGRRVIVIDEDVHLKDCLHLRELPANLIVNGFLDLSGCINLRKVSKTLNVSGYLDLEGCTSLVSLPKCCSIDHDLDLGECTSLTILPENMEVKGNLNLRDCSKLANLPRRLRIGGSLNLEGCCNLEKLPEELWFGSRLCISEDNLKIVISAIHNGISTDRIKFQNSFGYECVPSERIEKILEMAETIRTLTVAEIETLTGSLDADTSKERRRPKL